MLFFSFLFLLSKPSLSPFFLFSLELIASFFFNYCFTNTHTYTPEYINPMDLYDVTCIEGEPMTDTLLTSIIPIYILNTYPYIHREA